MDENRIYMSLLIRKTGLLNGDPCTSPSTPMPACFLQGRCLLRWLFRLSGAGLAPAQDLQESWTGQGPPALEGEAGPVFAFESPVGAGARGREAADTR